MPRDESQVGRSRQSAQRTLWSSVPQEWLWRAGAGVSLFLGLLFSALALLSSMWWAVPCFLFLSAAVVCLLRSEPEEAIAPRIVRTRRSTTAAVAAPGELTVRDVMLVNPIAMPANAPVAAAARAMRDLDVGAVVVVEDERPLGVMTDRDTVVGIVSLDDLVGTADRSEG